MPLIDKTLLYVEDEQLIAEEMTDILELEVKEIIWAKNGKEGLEKYEKYNPDIIMTDINMPIMNGIEMLTKIRENNSDIPIIVLSAYNDTEYFIKTIEQNVSGYILKPIYLKQLFNVLNDTVEKLDLIKENQEYKNYLEHKVDEQISLLRRKDKILQLQSKHAAMGEMIDAIAHQWKQPIHMIKMNTELLGFDYDDGVLNKKTIEEFQGKTYSYIDHILSTLEEFRRFLRPDKKTMHFNAKNAIDSVLLLLKDELVKYNIEVNIKVENDIEIDAIENEFKHVILNIINNAKDAFVDNDILEQREINIILKDEKKLHTIFVCDNAGGIPENIINTVFDANMTTKDESKGTGIGLYMSKQIIEKIGGEISVENIKNGVCFKISLKSS